MTLDRIAQAPRPLDSSSVRILHLSHGYPPAVGGSETVICEFSERLVRRGHDVCVVTTTGFNTAAFREPGRPTMRTGEEWRAGVRVRRHRADPRLAPSLRRAQELAFRLRLPGNGALRTVYDGPLAPGHAARRRERTGRCDRRDRIPAPAHAIRRRRGACARSAFRPARRTAPGRSLGLRPRTDTQGHRTGRRLRRLHCLRARPRRAYGRARRSHPRDPAGCRCCNDRRRRRPCLA